MLLEALSQRNVIGDIEPFIIKCYDSTVAWAPCSLVALSLLFWNLPGRFFVLLSGSKNAVAPVLTDIIVDDHNQVNCNYFKHTCILVLVSANFTLRVTRGELPLRVFAQVAKWWLLLFDPVVRPRKSDKQQVMMENQWTMFIKHTKAEQSCHLISSRAVGKRSPHTTSNGKELSQSNPWKKMRKWPWLECCGSGLVDIRPRLSFLPGPYFHTHSILAASSIQPICEEKETSTVLCNGQAT